MRNTGGQYHPFVRENWGLDPDKAWGIKITKVPFLDRRPKTPAAALTDAGRPNIIVLTPGRTGSGLLVKQLIALGRPATAEEFGEIPALYELNQRMLDSRGWPAAERDRFLSHLKTPWVLKNPWMIDAWDFWPRPIERQFGKPLVIWSVRDPRSIRESFNAADWTGAPWERRLERAKAIYAAYDGPKLILEHERLMEAMQLFESREQEGLVSVSGTGTRGALRLGVRTRQVPPAVGLAPQRNEIEGSRGLARSGSCRDRLSVSDPLQHQSATCPRSLGVLFRLCAGATACWFFSCTDR